jgi:hypothetical protein
MTTIDFLELEAVIGGAGATTQGPQQPQARRLDLIDNMLIGGAGGALAGAGMGFAFGAAIGGIGAIPGAAIGLTFGALAGTVGSAFGGHAMNRLHPSPWAHH